MTDRTVVPILIADDDPDDRETPAPRPGVILVDVNMPRMDGREAIAEMVMLPDQDAEG